MELSFILIVIVVLVILFYYYIIKPHNYWKDRGVSQGDTKWIVGDNWGMFSGKESFAEMIENVYNKCPGVRYSGMYQLFVPTLVLKDPDLIKQITVKYFDHFMDHRNLDLEDADTLWSKNLFLLKGQKWRDMRAILSPSFTSAKMKSMFLLIMECSENFVQHFLKKDEDVVTIELKDAFTRFANDVIASTVFGIQVDSLAYPNNEFYLMGKEATDFSGVWKNLKFIGYFLLPKLCKILKINLFSDEVTKFFNEIVSCTIKNREENGIVRQDMINLLLEARKGIVKSEEHSMIDTSFPTAQDFNLGKTKTHKEITDTDITAQAMIFFFAGFDSVSSLLSFLAYELAVNSDIQNRLRNEIMSTLEEDNLTYEKLLKLKYLDMVISETLRKWPIAAAVDRICTKPYTIEPVTPDESPVHLEKNTGLCLPIFGMHRDPKYFPNPDCFDPERFSEENKGNIKPYTYFPFGLGPRNCIGSRFALLETKMAIFHILIHFELIPVEKSRIPLQISKKQINLTAEGGFWFGLKRIKT